jgi:hypothetical protein
MMVFTSQDSFKDAGIVKQNMIEEGKTSFYIADWRKLWNHFAVDPKDVFFEHFSFYGSIAHFLCHGRTFRWFCTSPCTTS